MCTLLYEEVDDGYQGAGLEAPGGARERHRGGEEVLRGTSFSEEAVRLLREALRMRRVPGILFVDGLDSRRAAVAGTGLEVWKVVATHENVGGYYEELKRATRGFRRRS